MARRRTLIAGGTVLALVAALAVAQLAPGASPPAHAEGLVPYDSCSDLLSHYRDQVRSSATPWGFGDGYGGLAEGGVAMAAGAPTAARAAAVMPQAAAPAADSAGSKATGMEAVGNGATGTNVQEQGVDEPDLAKLRDGRLVVVTQGRVQVVTAEAKPKLVGSLRVTKDDEQTYGSELLLIDDRALLVIPGWQQQGNGGGGDARISMVRPGTPTTRLVLLDLSTDQPRLIEEATYDASYVSARLVDGTVRLVTSTRPIIPATYPQQPGEEPAALAANLRAADRLELSDVLPHVVRTAADGTPLEDGNAVTCNQTSHAQTPVGASTLLVTTLRPGSGLAPTDNDAITTDGDLVYASTDRLYVATSRWGTVAPAATAMEDKPTTDTAVATTKVDDEVRTEIHAFDTGSATTTRYLGTGSAPGYVLGRWAFSAYDGVLRVATTRQPPWDGNVGPTTSSMVVKLTEQGGALVETGRLEGLGKGERIQAVRYFGDIAAVVTFRQTDPLFLIDLSGQPRLLGELKVPGFSTYLHPIGGGRLLGLGQEADTSGRVQGAQISVFDVNDLAHPVQVDRLQLGQGWTPAMQDSRAFTYDPKRRMALFAYQVWDSMDGRMPAVGAVGIHVSSDGHLDEVGRMPVHPTTPTNRVLIDDAHLYAVSDSGVAAGDPATMQRTGEVDFAR